MMRLLVGLLIVANGLLFLYGYLELDREGDRPSAPRRAPDFGSIRILAATQVPASPSSVPVQERRGETERAPSMPATEAPRGVPEEPSETETASAPSLDVGKGQVEGETGSATETRETVEPVVVHEAPAPAPAGETAEEPVAPVATIPDDEEPAPPQASAPALYCGTLGPLRNRPQARRLKRKLGSPSAVRIEMRLQLVDKAYWVLLPPLPSRAEARSMVDRLREAGIKDLWLVPKGELRNAISLGLYSRREAAYAHADRLRGLGFDVEIRPRQEKEERYWLNFSGLAQKTLERLQSGLLPKAAEIEKKPCPQTSAAP